MRGPRTPAAFVVAALVMGACSSGGKPLPVEPYTHEPAARQAQDDEALPAEAYSAVASASSAPETPPAKETAPPEPEALPPILVEGKLVSLRANTVVMQVDDASQLETGASGTLHRYFERPVGPIKSEGWHPVAQVTVKKVKGKNVELAIDSESEEIAGKARKASIFGPGSKVRFEAAPKEAGK